MQPGQAIRNAIEAELAAARFYALLAESTDDGEGRAFLEELARQERAHAAAIERAGRALVDGALPEHAVGQVEVVETLPGWRFVDGLSLEQSLEVAIAAEQQAALYYDAFADGLEGELAEFFRELARQEEDHERQLRERRATVDR